ncbi:MAG: hypothetical protein A2Y25_03430 [Candidatus Melainabacteria bacterium GWF2_37_15]|nr:MAG: hypothetical protein A2Y25_03430 [Candidatus Melainabacteria bacterium GWF2_37_15]
MKANIPKGKKGEDTAVQYLEQQGFKIIEKNWRFSRYGEIDIIATDNDTLVFIEVKTRTSTAFGHPTEVITSKKLARMRKLAEIYINNNICTEYKNFRIDLIGILAEKTIEITHIKDI